RADGAFVDPFRVVTVQAVQRGADEGIEEHECRWCPIRRGIVRGPAAVLGETACWRDSVLAEEEGNPRRDSRTSSAVRARGGPVLGSVGGRCLPGIRRAARGGPHTVLADSHLTSPIAVHCRTTSFLVYH